MAKLWLTYCWLDNEDGQADFLATELKAALEIHLDRWTLTAGLGLWDQIKSQITDPTKSDAWAIYATPNSFASEPCIKEILFAVDRAKHVRGKSFPVIVIFETNPDPDVLPPLLRHDIYVSISDHDWKERIAAAAEGREPKIPGLQLEAFYAKIHPDPQNKKRQVIEVRPRVGTWCPFMACIPIEEKDEVQLGLVHGPRGRQRRTGSCTAPRKASPRTESGGASARATRRHRPRATTSRSRRCRAESASVLNSTVNSSR